MRTEKSAGRLGDLDALDPIVLGNLGDAKSVSAGIYEMRLFVRPGYRCSTPSRGGIIVLLLIGGDTSGQERDIRKAKETIMRLG